MQRHRGALVLFSTVTLFATLPARGALILYEPFDYPEDRFLAATAPNAGPNSTTSPIGYLAPNFNNWYGTGIAAATNYLVTNDAQVTATDLTVAGLYKPNATRSVSMGGTGHTFRLSLNTSSAGSPNQLGPNATDTADPLAGTDATLEAMDTAGTGYYSMAVQVTDLGTLDTNGGVLAGLNNVINAQTGNPTTAGAALAIRLKSGGNPGEFQLGITKGTSGAPSATWDTTNTYTTNSTIFVVAKYQTVGVPGNPSPAETNDIVSLWINPSTSTFGGFDPPNPLTMASNNDNPTNASTNNHTLQSIILRQTGAAANNQLPANVIFDELRVGTNYGDVTPPIPEPSSLLLVGLAGLALSRLRRR
jgi:hypothetical protein